MEAAPNVELISPQLAAALSHPTRVGVMSALVEGPASPRELAEAIEEPLSNVTYHVNQLRDLGCIELDRTERPAGGRVVEHFYRVSKRAYFDEDAWGVLDDRERLGVIWSALRTISADIATAMIGGAFFGEHEPRVVRAPMTVDEEGWAEIVDLLHETTKGLFEIEERVAERGADAGPEPRIHAKVEMLQFRSP